MFKALVLRKEPQFTAQIEDVDEAHLPVTDIAVDVQYSTLNFKDGLAITNKGPVVRLWPMIAGIDGAGTISNPSHPDWKQGDLFIHNGWGVGENHWGCLGQKAHLKSEWLVRLPSAFTPRQAMAIGTAGYTAMLCVMAIENAGAKPGQGEVVVTGATGGVGSVAIALLSRLGYEVVAITGKLTEESYLKALGATRVIDRQEFTAAGKPLQKERWAAAIDTAGSNTLANLCAQMQYGAPVAACGLAQGADLPLTVMPFILRGVQLLGIDSVMAPLVKRQQAWERLGRDLDIAKLETMIRDITLDQVPEYATALMAGQVAGRIVVKIQ
ncbi:zinc-binding dehydrogenase [Polynucleobacter sp. SHI8]|uniref:acrylyl-CoA reductase (NADPH) n=1 Tax=unclassified Polynucleobacter TaxID=2640945 RepID=UPI0024915F2A|nr:MULTISPECIES: MDR family oxidoreductase [unclassified Polynucleobacter]BDW11229.1 zinc-binding dehydrogenase [Polynucleobacter sp. SHI2]BDW13675.1 zinc-binding dehydrogenase [Polynucleobacter sp. SHI8]